MTHFFVESNSSNSINIAQWVKMSIELSLLLLYFMYCARAAVTFSNVHSRLAFLPKTLFMRLVYSGFNEAQDNATKR